MRKVSESWRKEVEVIYILTKAGAGGGDFGGIFIGEKIVLDERTHGCYLLQPVLQLSPPA